MKLFQINVVVNTGSTGRIAEELGKLALKKGWESHIAVGRSPYMSDSKVVKVGGRLNMYKHLLETRLFDNHGFSSKQATIQLIENIRKINPDIVHLHNLHGYYVHVGLLFQFLSTYNKPVVWTLHDCWAFTGHCAFYEFVNCKKWQTECYNCPQTQEYPKSLYRDNSRRNFRLKKDSFNSVANMTLVPVSNWLGDELKQSFLNAYPVKRIYNGVDLSLFNPSQRVNSPALREKLEGKFLIIGVANLWEEKRKGLQDFLQLSELLAEDELIILVGLNKKLLSRLPSNVVGIERTENPRDLAALYATSNVFFNPTWEDNFPTTNLEALACGIPIITYKTGGSVEVITPDTGFSVDKGDLSEVLKALEAIKRNGKGYYMGKCSAYVADNFNKNDRFQEYFMLYEAMLGTQDVDL